VAKISIIPRGVAALGYTRQQPTEDRYLLKKSELLDRLDVFLGGRWRRNSCSAMYRPARRTTCSERSAKAINVEVASLLAEVHQWVRVTLTRA